MILLRYTDSFRVPLSQRKRRYTSQEFGVGFLVEEDVSKVFSFNNIGCRFPTVER